jgi:Skp family chaperone for outer membrane proteins
MRAMFRTVSFVVAVAVAIGVGRLWAEDKEKKPAKPAPRTRVALINLTYVIKNYTKYTEFQEEIKDIVKPFQEKDAELRRRAELVSKAAQEVGLAEEKKEELESKLKKMKHQMEDNNAEAKKVLGKKTDAELKILYLDVTEAAQGYAREHNYEMVLHYNDAVTKEDYFSAKNVARKVQTGALMPLYAAPGLDVSTEILNRLNLGRNAAR